ncbi:hypothetical protein B0I33_10353 [Prauserella shujinwangii]|uniref:Outer membrane lipoprotein-sorting protein n=1 Tax=Prauserella shujinwangii TaxID=1453103 RepID=A0A2T0LY52_9PSEU|nr:outer membrane lipoprotein carrier protein LolA [Prauserella shujinwangii]PRX49020.1 hypothetical protein B0I33_10353 [Prauserella shujinwangii]
MNPKRKAVSIAAAGTALGVAGLAAIAVPAGAGEAPELPPVSAESLVESVLRADAPALSGTVEVDNDLGLPAVPGVPALDLESARVYSDGEGRSRLALEDGASEHTIVLDGNTLWNYDSATNTVTRSPVDRAHGERPLGPEGERMADPTRLAAEFLRTVRESSTVTVDGTARVADRAVYELVLTPKPAERTLLREVRVAVDSESRLPLRLSVHTNGTTEPALRIGFSDIDFGAQPAELFRFTPPEGATVEQEQQPQREDHMRDEVAGDVVGEGWDAVFVGQLPAGLLDRQAPGERGENVRGLLGQVGTPVSGEFGSGHAITTKVGTALVTDDGRVAFGAVPQQVLTEALGTR